MGAYAYELHLDGGVGARSIPNGSGDPSRYADIGSAGDYTANGAHLFNTFVSGDTGIIRVDGVQSGDVVLSGQSAADVLLRLGRRGDGGYSLNGDIAEVLIYNRSLGQHEKNRVQTYLNQKWGTPLDMTTLAETGGNMLGTNVASWGTAFAKNVITGYAAHAIDHLNDGLYGNEHSWIGLTQESFAGISFDRPLSINSIAFGRDNGGESNQYTDRYQGEYVLQYTLVPNPDESTSELDWITIADLTYTSTSPDTTGYLRHLYTFDRIWDVTGIRIVTTGLSAGGQIAIDEIEVGAVPEPSTALLGLLGFAGFAAIACRRRKSPRDTA